MALALAVTGFEPVGIHIAILGVIIHKEPNDEHWHQYLFIHRQDENPAP